MSRYHGLPSTSAGQGNKRNQKWPVISQNRCFSDARSPFVDSAHSGRCVCGPRSLRVAAGTGLILPSLTKCYEYSTLIWSRTLNTEIKGRACGESPLRHAMERIANPGRYHPTTLVGMHCASCIPAYHPGYPTGTTSAFVFGCSHLFPSSLPSSGPFGPSTTSLKPYCLLARTLVLSSLCICWRSHPVQVAFTLLQATD